MPEVNLERSLDLVPEAVVVLDDTHVITHLNDRALVLLGLTRSDVGAAIAKALDLIDDGGNPAPDDAIPFARHVDRIAERVWRVRLPDGRLRPVSMAGRMHPGGVVLTFRSAGRRERVDAARSDLVATVSHEIRSPLTSVKGFTRTLLSRWDRFSDEQKRTMLETINEDADRVTRLLKELLDVSRIDAGRVQLHRQMVDISATLHSIAEKAAHRPEGAERSVPVDAADDLPRVYADPDKVEQVVTNLVDNALKYAPASQVRVIAVPLGDDIHIRVEDDGPGIPEDQQRRVFEKFGRGRANRRAGTGLGLYITRGLVEAHGGRVWCESQEGVGSTFHVALPVGRIDVGVG